MHGQLGYPYQQQPILAEPPVARPPSFEGTVLASTLGAGAGALATQGLMYLGNFQPKTLLANGLITAGVAAFGGTTGALTYRMGAKRAYHAAQQFGYAGPNSFRVSGNIGRLGRIDINVPVQGIIDATQAYHRAMNPNTPSVVHQYYDEAAKHATEVAAQGFTQCMPPPQAWAQPAQPQPPQPPPYPYYCAPPPPPPQYCAPQPPPYPYYYQTPPQQQQAPQNGTAQ